MFFPFKNKKGRLEYMNWFVELEERKCSVYEIEKAKNIMMKPYISFPKSNLPFVRKGF